MLKKILRYSFATGLLASGLLVINEYFMHQGWLWSIIYIAPPIAVVMFFAKESQKMKVFFTQSYAYLIGNAIIVGILELPIYQWWGDAQTSAGQTYTRYQTSSFYPFPGMLLVFCLPLLVGFWLWIMKRGEKQTTEVKTV